MSFEFLEINRLTESGEVERRIRCLVGRVSVFRSQSEAQLNEYIHAIEGKPTKDRFTVLLDTNTFVPSEHRLIGFGEHFEESDSRTVEDFVTAVGIPRGEVEPFLLSCGLGGLSQASLSELKSFQERILRLMVSTQESKVLILNEPFHDIPDPWRERIAELLIKHAWGHKAIVIVVRLSYRPDCWVENEHITRIPLERPRQHTIGIGGGEFSSAAMMTAFREQLTTSKTSPQKPASQPQPTMLAAGDVTGDPVTERPKKPPLVWGPGAGHHKSGDREWLKYVIVLALSFTMTAAALLTKDALSRNSTSSPIAAARNPMVNPPLAAAPAAKTVLDEMPSDIREAVKTAFLNPDEILRAQQANTPAFPARAAAPTEQVSNIVEYESQQTEEYSQLSEEQIQARRDEIRRKFLEAVQRQSDDEL